MRYYTTVGMAALAALLLSARAEPTLDSLDVVYVDPLVEASDTGRQGDSWADCVAFSNALLYVKPGGTILVKAGIHTNEAGYATTKPVTIKGGYKGASGTSLELADDPVTVLDGNKSAAAPTLLTVTASSGTFVAERLDFRRGLYRGLKVTGGASVALTNCTFRNNGSTTITAVQGRGVYLTGSATATVSLSGCSFYTNIVYCSNNWNQKGCSVYATTFKSLELTDCMFLRNGIDTSQGGRDNTPGGGFYVLDAPLRAKGCKFFYMSGQTHSGNDGGAMYLGGASSGSTFVNCLWSKCDCYGYNGAGGAPGCPILIGLSAKTQTVLFDRCTFAYNTMRGGSPRSGAVQVGKGTVTVRNSIIWGNTSANERDFYVGGSGVLNLDNNIIGGIGSANVGVGTGGAFNPGANFFEDPLFVTDATTAGKATADKIDFHVKSTVGRYLNGAWVTDAVHSPAIDTATEDADYALEPSPNGGIANLGFYGGTKEASKSVTVVPEIASVTVLQDDYTRPSFEITLGGTGGYRAAVYLCLGFSASDGTGTNGWANVIRASAGAANGDVVTQIAPEYYNKGDKLYYRAAIYRGGKLVDTEDGNVTLVNDPPPFRGKGGGEHIIHLREGAVGNGTGTNWEHAVTTLAAALALLSNDKNEIWVSGRCVLGGTTKATRTFTLRGGFAGTECAAGERTGNAVATLDGEGTASGLEIAASSGTFDAERITFYNAFDHNLKVTGGASIALAKCRLEKGCWNNTGNNILGRGAYLTGNSSATLTLSECAFVTNIMRSSNAATAESGCGLYAKTFKRITMDKTDFVYNGNGTSNSGRSGTWGAGVYIEAAPVTARNCRFLGLSGMTHAGGNGGAMYLTGACGGSAFTNCCWIGSYFKNYQGCAAYAGTMLVNLSSKESRVDFEKCTFACNYAYGSSGGALMVLKGTANARNSIFWNNYRESTQSGSVKDVYVGGNGIVSLDHCIQAEEGNGYTLTSAGGLFSRTSMTAQDPLFASVPATSTAMLAMRAENIDVHVHSTVGRLANGVWTADADHSPAIDAATADADWTLEPSPNGGVANLGFYGGTAEASKSIDVQPAITNVVVTEPDYTRPTFAVMLGGSGNYHVSVYLCLGKTAGSATGTNGWDFVTQISSYAGNGETVIGRSPRYFAQGDTLYWNAVAIAGDDAMYCKTGSTTLTGENPPFRGHGGGANVIHLRADSAGDGAGTNWEHAVSTFAEALKKVTPTRNEIWVSGTCPLGTFAAPTNAIVIRGGFTGTEDSAAARTPGAGATLDGEATYDGLWFGAATGTNRVERLTVKRCQKNGIRSTAGASLEIVDSVVCNNGREPNGMNGRGLYVTGRTADTTLFVSNSQIVANRQLSADNNDPNNCGQGAYLATLKHAYFYDTVVATNGTGLNSNGSRSYAYGAAIYAAAPLTMVRSRVLGHGACAHDWDKGGIVWLASGSGGSAFTNCLFMGNGATCYQGGFNGGGSGALCVSPAASETCDIASCTFAFNYSHGTTAGLWVRSGTVNVIDSLFWGNVNGTSGADLRQDGGTLQLTRTLFGGTNAAHIAISATTRANMQKCVFADPLMVTTTNEFLAALSSGSVGTWPTMRSTPAFRSEAAVCGFNVHVRSVNGYDDEKTGARVTFPRSDGISPAIGTGSLGARLQPAPHGVRRNLGYYGGTPYATRSVPVGMFLRVR